MSTSTGPAPAPAPAPANVNPVASTPASTSATSTPKATNISKSPTRESNLAPLLRHFVGINVLVETKNGRSFRGRVVEADAYMNVVLDNRNRIALTPTSTKIRDKRIRRDGIFGVEHRDDGIENIDIDGRENENGDIDAGEAGGGDEGDDGGYDWVHVRGSTIRYIVFGANVDVSGVIKAGRDRERSAGDKYRRGVRKGPG